MAEIHELAILAANNTGRWPEGLQVSGINNAAREDEAILGRFSRDIGGANLSTGTGTAYLLEPYRTFSELASGIVFAWRAHLDCGVDPTLALDGLTAKNLTDANDRNLTEGDIVQSQMVLSYYNASTDAIECIGIKNTVPKYAVASLPTGVAGMILFATDGRKNGEGGGSGTGVLVFHDGTAWRACDTGATVAA